MNGKANCHFDSKHQVRPVRIRIGARFTLVLVLAATVQNFPGGIAAQEQNSGTGVQGGRTERLTTFDGDVSQKEISGGNWLLK